MRAEEQLLGFDARVMWIKPETVWSQERKSTYLLRTDVDKPLSVDTRVWSSVLPVGESSSSISPTNSFGLWDDLTKLEKRLNAVHSSIQQPYWVIGIKLEWDTLNQPEQELWYSRLPETVPSTRAEGWSFLGYDIADLALLSGLSNCGYKPQEVESLRERWGKHLNKFHLFTDLYQAIGFKEISNRRVPEHSPFFVYGLYLIQEH